MQTTIETGSGDIHVRLTENHPARLLSWWPQVSIVAAETEDSPFPWQLRLDQPEGISGLRIHSGTYGQRASALGVLRFQRAVLPAAISEFLTYGFEGTLLPASFFQEHQDGTCSAGHLLFGHSPRVRSEGESASREEAYERAFGPGATNLFLSFAHATSEAWTASGLPPRRLGRIEIIPGADAGQVFADFCLADQRVYHLTPELRVNDPVWESLAQAGLEEIWRLASYTV